MKIVGDRLTASHLVHMQKYRLKPLPQQVSPQILLQLKNIATATIGHFYPWGLVSAALRRLHPVKMAAGTAVTLTMPGADSTLLHDVIGPIRHGDRRHACCGTV